MLYNRRSLHSLCIKTFCDLQWDVLVRISHFISLFNRVYSRWLLLTFKREFSYKDGLRIFEIISSRHLEVSSLEAEMERSRERARELEKDGENAMFFDA